MDITKDKREKKWEADKKRRAEVAKAIDFYNNQQEGYTLEHLQTMYSEKAQKKLAKYMKCDPITQNIIDDMSVMFQSGVSVNTGVPAADEFLTEVFDYSQFQSLCVKIDRLVNLQKKLAVVPFYDKQTKRFYFDVITGDKAFIEQREDIPTLAKTVFYSTGILIDSPTIADQTNIYVEYTQNLKRKVEIDSIGQVSKVIESIPNPYLPYNEVPFAWFYDDLNIDTFWSETSNKMVKDNLDINRLLINLGLMLDYQTFSTLVTTGLDSGQPLYLGPQFHLNLSKKSYSMNDPNPDAKYITPDAKLMEVWNIICSKAVRCAKSAGLSAQAYTTDAKASEGYNSGYQLRLSKIDIINRNKMRQIFFIQAIKRLVKLLLMTSNIYASTSFQVNTMDINVTIYDPSIDLSPLELEQVRAQKTMNGTWSAIRSIMEDNPDMTIEDATKLYQAMAKERQLGYETNPLFSPDRLNKDKKTDQSDEESDK